MSVIVIAATSPCYITSLGAMSDAIARLGESFESNEALGDFSTMETRLTLVGTRSGSITLAGGRELVPDSTFERVSEPRLIYLPNFQLPDLERFAEMRPQFEAFYQWLKAQVDRGVMVGACGTSVLHLAAMGLTDKIACVASPRLVGLLRTLAPRMHIDTDAAIRHESNIWTCGRDADNPALVARLFVECFSPELGRSLAMREPPGREADFLSSPVDPMVARAQLWMQDRFTKKFRIADLARELGLSHQALIRRFAAAGIGSPRHFVQKARVDAAASMLLETNRSVSEVAQLVGYIDTPSFRRVFRAERGMTPSTFRTAMRP